MLLGSHHVITDSAELDIMMIPPGNNTGRRMGRQIMQLRHVITGQTGKRGTNGK